MYTNVDVAYVCPSCILASLYCQSLHGHTIEVYIAGLHSLMLMIRIVGSTIWNAGYFKAYVAFLGFECVISFDGDIRPKSFGTGRQTQGFFIL